MNCHTPSSRVRGTDEGRAPGGFSLLLPLGAREVRMHLLNFGGGAPAPAHGVCEAETRSGGSVRPEPPSKFSTLDFPRVSAGRGGEEPAAQSRVQVAVFGRSVFGETISQSATVMPVVARWRSKHSNRRRPGGAVMGSPPGPPPTPS
jgi:hypothetical protein